MLLGNLLNVADLRQDIANKKISVTYHPTLPLAILNYTHECSINNYWSEPVKICRGLIVELSGYSREIIPESTVVARPFRKFFGLKPGHDECEIGTLPNVTPIVTEKVDGWLGVLWTYHDKTGTPHWGISSRGSFTSAGAEFATGKLQKLIKYGAIHEFPEGYTPVFEIVFKVGRIVVQYPFEGLVLLGCVNIETGEELPYDVLRDIWAKIASYSAGNPWIRLVHAHNMTLEECQEDNRLDREGYVLSYPRSGTWPIKVKVKLAEYRRLHRLITNVTPQQIWRKMSDPVDEMTKEVPPHFRRWVVSHRARLNRLFLAEILTLLVAMDTPPVKEYLTSNQDLNDPNIRQGLIRELTASNDSRVTSLALLLIDNKATELFDAIWSHIRPHGQELDSFYKDGEGE